MRTSGVSGLAAVALSAVAVTACGGDEERAQARPVGPSTAAVEKDPYAIACGHVRDQIHYAQLTRRATVAIADRERFKRLNRLRATQSVFYAMTEVCKGKPDDFRPAAAAVRGVRDGTYVADLSSP